MEEKYGLDQLNRRVLQEGLCAACGACLSGCPYLTCFRGKTVMLDRCAIEQGRCFAYCPMTFFDREAVSLSVFGYAAADERIGHFLEVAASRATDSTIAAAGQGGGTVTALLVSALQEGVIDAAVLTADRQNEGFPGGLVAATADEVVACAGSKYVGAHSLAALRIALDRGYERIGIVGLPCQVRSARKMIMYDLKRENLGERIRLVVGLFCNWAFSGREFAAFLSGRYQFDQVGRIHVPPPPAQVLEIETDGGVKTVPLDEVRPLIQPACNQCSDMTSDFADLSVGMYEGREGWNTLIVRTRVGMDLFRKAVEIGYLETENFPETNLAHLKNAAANKRRRAAEKRPAE